MEKKYRVYIGITSGIPVPGRYCSILEQTEFPFHWKFIFASVAPHIVGQTAYISLSPEDWKAEDPEKHLYAEEFSAVSEEEALEKSFVHML